jgi:hypothetical protein
MVLICRPNKKTHTHVRFAPISSSLRAEIEIKCSVFYPSPARHLRALSIKFLALSPRCSIFLQTSADRERRLFIDRSVYTANTKSRRRCFALTVISIWDHVAYQSAAALHTHTYVFTTYRVFQEVRDIINLRKKLQSKYKFVLEFD